MNITFGSAFDARRVLLAERKLPFEDASRRTDIYFSRTLQVLRKKELNPWVRGQMFLRNPGRGSARLGGVYDLIGCFTKFAPSFFENGGRMWFLPEGSEFGDTETVGFIEGRAQDFVEIETLYLGLLSAGTSQVTYGTDLIDFAAVTRKVKAMRAQIARSSDARRPLVFFGMRHYHPKVLRLLTEACFAAGENILCSTPLMGEVHDQNAVGTIPHFLENVVAHYFGDVTAVATAMRLFDEVIDPRVNRTCLVDWRNHELDDARTTIAMVNNLSGFRLDTAGENVCQGAIADLNAPELTDWRERGLYFPAEGDPLLKYWMGRGVTVSAARALVDCTRSLRPNLRKPFLTSGFSNPHKIEAFVDAEELLGEQLFSGIGFGEITDDDRSFAKLDLIAVGDDPDRMHVVHKKGRAPKPSTRLLQAAGTFSSPDEQPNFGETTAFMMHIGR